MRTRILAGVLPALVLVAAVAAPQPASSSGKRDAGKKDDDVVVTGCLAGSVLTATESGSDEETPQVAAGNEYRLTGPKDIIKQLKKLNGRAVEVTGTVRPSNAPGGFQTRVGKTTIAVGGATNHDPMRPINPIPDPTVPPELKVKSFRDLDYSCAEKKK